VFPDDGASGDELLRQADAAMYRDKQQDARQAVATRREG
jgi:GGDEF domain-containing protein